ncbi:hypothetical protein GOV12_06385 [Candidatus Pacearchaeota archaeon]|nr:hypothetical protein [Candidatus Pacearchaeota archaeon]
MTKRHRKRQLMQVPITPSNGNDYVIGMFVFGDIKKDSQIESGLFLKGSRSRDLRLYPVLSIIGADRSREERGSLNDDVSAITSDTWIGNIEGKDELGYLLTENSCEMYDGENILLLDSSSNLASRYESLPPECLNDLERIFPVLRAITN